MTNSEQAIREFAEVITQQILTYLRAEACFIGEFENEIRKKIEEQFTALISEHYYPKDMVRWTFNQRFMACGHTGFDSSILELDLEYWNEHIKGKENER